jgi:hypothetical protein
VDVNKLGGIKVLRESKSAFPRAGHLPAQAAILVDFEPDVGLVSDVALAAGAQTQRTKEMATRSCILFLAASGVALFGWDMRAGQQPAAKVPEKLLQAQLESARQTYQEAWKDQQFRSAEVPYQWSCRWLEAERLLSDNKKDQKAAVVSHLARMRDLKKSTDQLNQQKLLGIEQVYAAAYYVAEAEVWVARLGGQ